MAEYTKVVPCKITYTYNPAEKETMSEPGVAVEYILTDVSLANTNLLDCLSDKEYDFMSDKIYEYLKESYYDAY